MTEIKWAEVIELEDELGAPLIVKDVSHLKGGLGSGHHGHRGRPGKRGGSAPGEIEPITGLTVPRVLKALRGDTYLEYGDEEDEFESWEVGAFGQHRLALTRDGDIYVIEKECDPETLEEVLGSYVGYNPRNVYSLMAAHGKGLGGREEAVSLLARELGWGKYVPLTALDQEYEALSRQVFVPDGDWMAKGTKGDGARQGFIMDRLVGQADRHAGNVIWSPSLDCYVFIDNELSFPAEHYPRTVFDIYTGTHPGSKKLLSFATHPTLVEDELERIDHLVNRASDLREQLEYLVGEEPTEYMFEKARAALNSRTVPW